MSTTTNIKRALWHAGLVTEHLSGALVLADRTGTDALDIVQVIRSTHPEWFGTPRTTPLGGRPGEHRHHVDYAEQSRQDRERRHWAAL